MEIIERFLPYGAARQTPTRIVIHAMGERIAYPAKDSAMPAADFLSFMGLSAHYLIAPDNIIMCRLPEQGAYHAKGYNTGSIGIEFLVPGTHNYTTFKAAIKEDYLSAAQFNAGVKLVRHLVSLYNITKIDRHSDLSPTRKVDPGSGFDWNKFTQHVGLTK